MEKLGVEKLGVEKLGVEKLGVEKLGVEEREVAELIKSLDRRRFPGRTRKEKFGVVGAVWIRRQEDTKAGRYEGRKIRGQEDERAGR